MDKPQIKTILGLCAILALASLGLFVQLWAQQPSANQLPRVVDPKAQQLLDRAIQALGGQAFLNAKSLTTRGRIFFFEDSATAGMQPFQSYSVFPDKRRFSYGKTLPVILINNGDKGYELDKYGLIAQPQEQLERWNLSNRYTVENLLRLRIKDPGVLIQATSVDFVDNVAVQGITIIAAGGTSVRLDLNRQTILPVRINYRVRNVKEDAWDEYADAYSDYKMFDGIQTPMHITRYLNSERIGETFRNYAKYNEDYPPNYFNAE